MRRRALVLAALGAVLLAAPALAHVPGFAGENTSHGTAMHIEDGATSRAIYAELDAREVRYYEVHLEPGERLQVSAFTPTPGAFTPSLVVYGDGVTPSGTVPDWVAVPADANARVVEGTRTDRADFEPFTPAAYYQTAAVSLPAGDEGHYWVAVYDPTGTPGRVGTAIGYEETFTTVEYLMVPFDLLQVHRWEGDFPLLLAGPYAVVFVLTGLWLQRRWPDKPSRRRIALATAGALYLSSGLLTAIQLLIALSIAGLAPGAVLTLGFVLVPSSVGAWLVLLAGRPTLDWTPRGRAAVVLAGALGLVTWGGLLVGPALAAAVGLVPSRNRP